MISKSLVGKFFILRQSVGHGQILLSRGRIAARLDDLFPAYLCEVWPQDESMLTSQVQMIVTLDDLKQAFFFDDEVIWQENFRDIITKLEAMRKEREAAIARQKAAERRARKQSPPAPTLTEIPNGIELVTAIDPDQLEDLLKRLQGRGGDE